MTMHFAAIAQNAAAEGVISAKDLAALRRAGWANGAITPDEAEAIFAANHKLAASDPDWCDFFVEAIGEYVINGSEPRGYVSDDRAAWLIHRVEQDGKLDSMAELELLVRVLERSQNAPQLLKDRVLAHVEAAVLTGAGPTRRGGQLAAGQVTAAEADILRRTIFAAGGDGPACTSRAEAELLFRLKDASVDAPNAPEWQRMFVQGVASYLQGSAASDAQLSRERALELETFMNAASPRITQVLGRIALASPNVLDVVFGRKQPPRDRLGELASAEQVTESENAWLQAEIAEDGRLDPYEQALLDFLAAD